ncbi:hypothetical protein mRhiFer1_009488 [Rhinolophus ferrumequinum]|uniref:Uncharacterized protein n=1 Tax=Rhinolophus ferrumequinum TaxID=59479 RepID=A0A7J7RF09_RHIFE|nr:hypothetical protein mRhiFer1_009488 [Rhinolophus ferrumequinum]
MRGLNLLLALGRYLLAFFLLALLREAGIKQWKLLGGDPLNLSLSHSQMLKVEPPAAVTDCAAADSTTPATPTASRRHQQPQGDTNSLKAQRPRVAGARQYLSVEMGSRACRESVVAGDRRDLTPCTPTPALPDCRIVGGEAALRRGDPRASGRTPPGL